MGNESSRKVNVDPSTTSDSTATNNAIASDLRTSINMNVSYTGSPVETLANIVASRVDQGDTLVVLEVPSEEKSPETEVHSKCDTFKEKSEDKTDSLCGDEGSKVLEETPVKLQDTEQGKVHDDFTNLNLKEDWFSNNVRVVNGVDEEKDGTAELVGLLFDGEEERVEITTVWTFTGDGDGCHSKEQQEKYENSEENPASNEPQAYSYWSAETNNEGPSDEGGSPAVVYFSPREVHNGKVIGEGGFGRVLKGSLHGGTPVAIKLFHAPLPITSELEELFSLKHKNIVTVFGIVRQEEEIYCPQLVLQYISEGNVLQYLSRHENPEDNSTLGKITLDVTEGCQFLHQQGIVHGNLAARNVLVEKIVGRHKTYYNAKVSDIGLIRYAEVSGGNYMKIPGTDRVVPVRWVPKEIIQEQDDGSIGTDFTFESDVWGFGVLLWEIWTRGAIPYGASYSNLRVMQFLKDGYSPLKVHRPTECPTKIVSLMESIFQVEPNERPTFDQLVEHFKKYRGHGKEHKSKQATGGGPRGILKDSPTSRLQPPDLAEDDFVDEIIIVEEVKSKVGDKSGLQKKKKNKKPKRLYQGKPASDEWSMPSTVGLETAIAVTADANTEMEGAAAILPEQTYSKPESSTDSTIVQLLKRVNQLEKERRGGNHGGYIHGRSRGGPHNTNWQKRSGPPRFNRGGRGGYLGKHYNESTSSVQSRPVVSPPSSALAPPPYTEDPLPHHSTSRFSAPLPEYEYDHNPGPTASRVGVPSGRYPDTSGHRNHTIVLDRTSSPPQEEDFIRKIKRLAEEIEFLRAEKMTQELLKKSAELADIMKVVTSERSEPIGMAVVDSRYSNDGNRANRSVSPRHLVARGDQYYSGVYDGYGEYDNSPRGDGMWQPEQTEQMNYHQSLRPPIQRQNQPHRGGGVHNNSQRRPYYKGRGGGNGHRGHSNNGRYSGDGSGSYGPGPYGNM